MHRKSNYAQTSRTVQQFPARCAILTKQPRPIWSTILLYLANLPPEQPVAWGRETAADLRRTKLGKLSPNTVYKALEKFRLQGLVELVNPQPPVPTNPSSASVTTMSRTELKRQEVIKRLQRAGWPPDEIQELEKRRAKQGGLTKLKPSKLRALIQLRKSTGFRAPDPRAIGYRLTTTGRKIAELLKQHDLLTQWWLCRDSPTDNTEFVQTLRARGFEPEDIKTAEEAGVLTREQGIAESVPQRYGYSIQTQKAMIQALTQPQIIVQLQRCRYHLA